MPLDDGSLAAFARLGEQLHGRDTFEVSQSQAVNIQRRAVALLSRSLERCEATGVRRVPRYPLAVAALSLIDHHADHRISVADLADSLDVTSRALEYAFMSTLGVTPVGYMLARRLNRVRRDLTATAIESVTSAASRSDFAHLSRFTQQYRRLFGELPSHTRREATAKAVA